MRPKSFAAVATPLTSSTVSDSGRAKPLATKQTEAYDEASDTNLNTCWTTDPFSNLKGESATKMVAGKMTAQVHGARSGINYDPSSENVDSASSCEPSYQATVLSQLQSGNTLSLSDSQAFATIAADTQLHPKQVKAVVKKYIAHLDNKGQHSQNGTADVSDSIPVAT